MFLQYTLNSETGQFYHKETQHSKRKLLNDISYDGGRMTYHHTVTQSAPSFQACVHLAATISFLLLVEGHDGLCAMMFLIIVII